MTRSYAHAIGLVLLLELNGCSGSAGPDTPRSIEQGLCDNDPNDPCCPGSPIILDLNGDGFDLTDLAGGVHFNLNPSGDAERISWTAPGSDDAWLVLDRNGNGVIDDGTELFGNFTAQPSSDSPQGYLALAALDLNHDKVIDSEDMIFNDLRLWQDRNHDGVSDPDELSTLGAHGILGLDVRFKGHRQTDAHGNLFRYSANVFRAPGSRVGPMSYDVFLITQHLDQQAREQGAFRATAQYRWLLLDLTFPVAVAAAILRPQPAGDAMHHVMFNRSTRAHNARIVSPDAAAAPRRGRHVPRQRRMRTQKFRGAATSGIATATVPRVARPRPTTTIS